MTGKSFDDLGELQRAALEVVWQLGQANVHEVRRQIARRKKLAYTTILTALQKLEKTGWLTHRPDGKSYIYLPARTREQAGARSVRKLIKHVFDGDAVLMFQHLIRETNLNDKELHQLRLMIDQQRKEQKK